MSENQRLKIIRETLKLTQKDFGDSFNLKQGSYADVERGKAKVSGAIKRILEKKLSINIEWLETGNGEMFIEKDELVNNILREPEVTYQRTPKGVGVPVYYDAISTGLFANNELKPVAWLNTAEFANCEAVIQVKDDSMAGTMNERDWVGIKQIKNWQAFLPMNYMYALVTDDFELIRTVRKGSTDDKLSLLSPGNEHYTNEIDKSLIREVWSVKVVLPYSKIETLL